MTGKCDACFTENVELKLVYDSFGVDIAAMCIDHIYCVQKQREEEEIINEYPF